MRDHTADDWARAQARVMTDPLLRPPSQADRDLVAFCGGTVNEQIAGAR